MAGVWVYNIKRLSSHNPPAPAGNILVKWASDIEGNVSGYVPGDTGSSEPASGFLYTVVSKSANYTAVSGDDVWTTGTITITLPALSTTQRVKINNRGTGVITVVPTAGLINGQASLTIARQYSSAEFSGDGTNVGIE
jgi:hypothetical protein